MKKIRNRAVSVLLLACLVICGLVVYVLRYVDDGQPDVNDLVTDLGGKFRLRGAHI